jgi:hypothetical protein
MQILVACEESQAVTIALRKLGHEAYSCDLIPCSGGHPEWHIQQDVLPLLNGYCFFKTCDGSAHYVLGRWDMLIAFPPCTYLTNASAVRMRVKGEIVAERYAKAMEAKAFFMSFLSADCAKIAVENPTPLKIVELPPYTQAIQPWQFGHPYTKRTCLWLKELPLLVPTEIITEGVTPWVNGGCKDAHGNYRRFQGRRERDPINRAKTFPGIAARRNGGTMGRARDYLISHPSAVCGGQFYMERTEHMAVNKITHSWNEDYTGLIFTGSQRQPTLVEVRNYCVAQHIPLEGVYIAAVRLGGEWTPPEDAKSLEIFEFGENCPVCGKAFVLDTDICPICHKRWDS